MPDTSALNGDSLSASEIASIFQELQSAEKTADALEGRLDTLEKQLDELLAALEKEEQEAQAKAQVDAQEKKRTTSP